MGLTELTSLLSGFHDVLLRFPATISITLIITLSAENYILAAPLDW